ncbi:LptF/LptG family permease [Bacteriovorax sp. Seq25_V]|uniref:LptF/LptG family permease n=1 Tax=Bacteriovorax sp. Seq25_V TaxID=1201288 RepID=UPI000389DDEA|nr:LptF/LptG family permease [Bacteriovorax sp. Seq25_V]EQC43373.1 permease, YjgP/YjgQ family [Bacteriovorax sp. Seq25_V]
MIIRKLITREWIRFCAAAFVALLSLLSVGNLVTGFMRGNVSASEVLLSYLIQVPNFMIQILPVSCLIASLFSINKLKNRNELTAIFAAGYSRQSYIIDLLQVSTYVAVLQFILSAYISPYINSKRFDLLEDSVTKFRSLKTQGLSSSTIGSGEVWYKSGDYYFSFSHFDTKANKLFNINIYSFDTEYKLKKITSIPSMSYNFNDKTWLPDNVKEIALLNTPTFPRIEEYVSPIFLNEQLEDFKKIESDITTLSFFKLYDYIRQLRRSGINIGEYLVIFYKHISDSIICIIFALLAAIPIFNPNRRNSSFGKSASFVFTFTLLYWLVQTYFIELGKNLKIIPLLACFTVPFLFSVFIFVVFYKNRKLA